MSERWVWYDVFDLKFRTIMDYESKIEQIKFMQSKTLSWDLAEMIVYRCASECLERKCFK